MKYKRLTRTDGFTLVELIVVITILAILGTIGFTSYVGTTRYARNSARAADLSTMRASLEIYQARWGQYPSPSYPEQVTYSGALVFTRGTFGPNTVAAVNSLSKKPVDPLHGVEYTYALLASGHQYELGAITEDGVLFAQVPSLIEHAHAAFDSVKAHVTGSYNGQVALAKL